MIRGVSSGACVARAGVTAGRARSRRGCPPRRRDPRSEQRSDEQVHGRSDVRRAGEHQHLAASGCPAPRPRTCRAGGFRSGASGVVGQTTTVHARPMALESLLTVSRPVASPFRSCVRCMPGRSVRFALDLAQPGPIDVDPVHLLAGERQRDGGREPGVAEPDDHAVESPFRPPRLAAVLLHRDARAPAARASRATWSGELRQRHGVHLRSGSTWSTHPSEWLLGVTPVLRKRWIVI